MPFGDSFGRVFDAGGPTAVFGGGEGIRSLVGFDGYNGMISTTITEQAERLQTLANAIPPRESRLNRAVPLSCWASGTTLACEGPNDPAVLARRACVATGTGSSSSSECAVSTRKYPLIVIDSPSKTGAPPNLPRLEKLGNVFDLVGGCDDKKYDKIGDFDGDKLDGNMRGGVVLPSGV